MEFALEAPTQLLNIGYARTYQWARVSRLDSEAYKDYYSNQSDLGHYVTLHQDMPLAAPYLVQIAEDIGATEIALMCALRNSTETIEIVQESLLTMLANRTSRNILISQRLHFLLTPQGRTVSIWGQCLRALIRVYLSAKASYQKLFPFAPTVGVHHPFLRRLKDQYVDDALSIMRFTRNRYDVQFHLIDWLGDESIIEKFPFRSVSTMQPFRRAAYIRDNDELPKGFLDRRFSEIEQRAAKAQANQLVKGTRLNGEFRSSTA